MGQKLANPFGLYDMHGNVYEWCQNWYAGYGSEKVLTDPTDPTQGERRVLRGGSFLTNALYVRSADRAVNYPLGRSNSVGFRAARTYR